MSNPKRKSPTVLDLTCPHCGIAFRRAKSRVTGDLAFCTKECYWKSDYRTQCVGAANRRRNPEALNTRPCGTCGVAVTRYISTGQKTFYCSRQCRFDNHVHAKHKNAAGYVLVFVGKGTPGAVKSGHKLEHRIVMEQMLGRSLRDKENVHHINGVKHDNRPENLELWTTSQPKGQRVEDKIAWARHFLALYGEADSSDS